MDYLAKAPADRADPRRRFPWARSLVCVAMNYKTADACPPAERRPFSRYAWGEDYHDVVRDRLVVLLRSIESWTGEALDGRAYVDTGPILERPAAARAGLGWLAKNTMLISQEVGSWLFLGELLLPYELVYDRAAPGRCGTCRRCLDACPTRAFVAPYLLDARRCISYLTIELRGPIPREMRPLVGELVFGCDICQEVCPWNRKAPETDEPAFRARPGLASAGPSLPLGDLVALLDLAPDEFARRFRGSPIKRAKRRGLQRNVCVALGNRGDAGAVPALARVLRAHDEALVRGHAAWALGRIGGDAAEAALEAASRSGGEPDPWVREEIALALGHVRTAP